MKKVFIEELKKDVWCMEQSEMKAHVYGLNFPFLSGKKLVINITGCINSSLKALPIQMHRRLFVVCENPRFGCTFHEYAYHTFMVLECNPDRHSFI